LDAKSRKPPNRPSSRASASTSSKKERQIEAAS